MGIAAIEIAETGLEQLIEKQRTRERGLSRLVATYALSGLLFMLVPGTFVGVWNLFAIAREHGTALTPAWSQAHGHAQIFGCIGTFILGIGFYSLPRATTAAKFPLWRAWLAWGLWVSGVLLRWSVGVSETYWEVKLVAGSLLELAAFAIFLRAVSGHRAEGPRRSLDKWIFVVIAGTVGFMAALIANAAVAIWLAVGGAGPAVPSHLNLPILAIATWGFLVPFVWGFSARWVPVFLGLETPRENLLLIACAVNAFGVMAAWTPYHLFSALLNLGAAVLAAHALRIFTPSVRPPKVKGVCATFPLFVRIAYGWLLAAGLLAVMAALFDKHNGLWGASRHALTVGFFSLMVFAIGQRVLPGFAGMKLLFSTRLMFASLLLLNVGCVLRVVAQSLAYERVLAVWEALPISAGLEMAAVCAFALNLGLSIALPRPATECT